MREVNDHLLLGVKDLGNLIRVEVADDPGSGGANHKYQTFFMSRGQWEKGQSIQFHKHIQDAGPKNQDVPPEPVVPNGITHEVLLSIVLDRLRSFQKGDFSCRENALAITHLEESLHWLQHRTVDRVKRGVEGTQLK